MKYFVIFLFLIGLAVPAFAIGSPPPERVPATSYGIYDMHGNSGEIFAVDEQIQIMADISNTQAFQQKFVYSVDIADWTGRVISWVHHGELEGTLEPLSSFSPSVSWIPPKAGQYKAKITLSEINSESRLSPDIEIEFFVVGNIDALDENKNCKEGKEKVFKNQFQKIACVSPETLVKLLDRGWARWHDLYIPVFINNLINGHELDRTHSEFVKREALKDSRVSDELFRKDFDYSCCEVIKEDFKIQQLVITFFYEKNSKQLSATYDLNEQKVIDFTLGKPALVEEQTKEFESKKYTTVFDEGSPLMEIGTGNPVLDEENCYRYAYWLTKYQKEKLDRFEDYDRYPPWGNQIYPLVEYCTSVGELVKTVVDDKIQWEFQLENEK